MSESHMNPEEAVQVSIDLNAKKAYGMHWGTFALTDEDTLEPKQRLEEELERQNLNNFTTLIPGQVVYLD
jgi:N-acyl-phosphatidylethanolamine-hydrolysing phospholipase D